ncbi:MAG: type VI secretion system baseplate subunit TssE [Burkholderiales bacterium]|nr:type VI secretion system baseplate subunit TssE [Burkholderiales bacterium]MDE1926080.1 type VI secretion system baseplate subunit TssE [Burkholderiales bacterium]MDE2502793.1 type VI secretion system baseplate subunit TssE [Burkholderiales bacterium]
MARRDAAARPAELRDRLQPALLDRLTDGEPAQRSEPEERRVMTRAQLRAAVLRDLGWLFNATQSHPQWNEDEPGLSGSVLNFGLPPLSGRRVSKLDLSELERTIAEALRRFEPRVLADTLVVRAVEAESVLDTHNMIEFEIRGHLWAQPVPLEMLLRTRLDLEAGQVELRDLSRGSPLVGS